MAKKRSKRGRDQLDDQPMLPGFEDASKDSVGASGKIYDSYWTESSPNSTGNVPEDASIEAANEALEAAAAEAADDAPSDSPVEPASDAAAESTSDEPLVCRTATAEPESLEGKTVWVIDGHNIIYQVFHALPEMTGALGQPVGAVYGFARDLLYLLETHRPDYLFCAYDMPGGTFRNELYQEYKANRAEMPDDLRPQFRMTQRLLAAVGVPALGLEGYEADDLLATIARQVESLGGRCVLVTSDKDCRQLITDNVDIFSLRRNAIFSHDDLREAWGIEPSQVVEFQALVGDKTDNVPGVPLIGPKIAQELITNFETLEGLYEKVDEVRGKKRKENLIQYKDQAFLSRQLVKLCDDVPLPIDWQLGRVGPFDLKAALSLFDEFGFRGIRTKLENVAKQLSAGAPAASVSSSEATIVEPPPFLTDSQASITSAMMGEASSFAPAPKVEAEYVLVDTPERFEEFLLLLKQQTIVSLDTETTSLRPREAELVGISLCFENDRAWYLPVREPVLPADSLLEMPSENEDAADRATNRVLDLRETLEALRPILESADIQKVGQNLKYDMVVLRAAGVRVAGVTFDTMVADYLLEAGQRSHGLDELARRYLDHETIKLTELIGTGKKQKRMDQVPVAAVSDYAAEDALIPWLLRPMLIERLEAAGLTALFEDLEMPLVEVLADMEFDGVRFDPDRLSELSAEYSRRLDAIELEIYELAGRKVNINSPTQLRVVLFEELGLPVIKKTKTGPSTDAAVLAELAEHHALPAKIVEYRKYSKLLGTYVDAIPELIFEGTGRVHASFNQVVTATGRLSSSDPNLQNIPVREKEGREIRSALVADRSRGADVLVALDYSQIELRVLAHFCEDENLCDAFRRDEDIHARVAAEIYGIPLEEVTADQRRGAKAVNFGVIYGQSSFGLAKSLGIAQEEAARFIGDYFAQYPGIDSLLGRVLSDCRRDGYVTTILGRRRAIQLSGPSRRGGQLNLAERTAINTVIQGSAADIIKKAMLAVSRQLKQHPELGATMLVQIHDELVFEVPADTKAALIDLVKNEMESAFDLRVPLKVDVGEGVNWAEAK